MRDPSRIPVILDALRAAWEESPDMRLGQLVVNVTGQREPFYYEDDTLLDDLQEWRETSKTWKSR